MGKRRRDGAAGHYIKNGATCSYTEAGGGWVQPENYTAGCKGLQNIRMHRKGTTAIGNCETSSKS